MGIALSFGLSFGIAIAYALIIYALDRCEKEPKRLLLGVFLWGAVVAVIGSILAEGVFAIGVSLFTDSQTLPSVLTGSIAGPIVEATLKGLAVFFVFLIFRSEFDSILDGIVYAGIAALGFAAVENAHYAYDLGFREHGIEGMYAVLFLRGILAGWDHPMYTAFIGIGLAMARLTRDAQVRVFAPLGGWLIAVMLHSLHNTLIELLPAPAFILAVGWAGWLVIFGVIIWAIRREKGWIVRNLRGEIKRGIITADQYRVACSSWAQYGARLRALFSRRYLVTQRFYRTCAELAFKKEQLPYDDKRTDNALIASLRADLRRLSLRAAI